MRFDYGGAPAVPPRLNRVWINRSLAQQPIFRVDAKLMHRPRLNLNEETADDLPLFFRVGLALERFQKNPRCVPNLYPILQPERRQVGPKLVSLSLPHQAGIDIQSQHALFRQRHTTEDESYRRIDASADQE